MYTTEAVLEADEAVEAEVYVNKASALINAATDETSKATSSTSQGSLNSEQVCTTYVLIHFVPCALSGVSSFVSQVLLRYRVTYARVLDANRKFVEAAVRYHALSTTTTQNVSNPTCVQESTLY
jgi:hypothetical protein